MAIKTQKTDAWDRGILIFTFVEMLFLRWILIGQDTILLAYSLFLCVRLFVLGKGKGIPTSNMLLTLIPLGGYIGFNSILRSNFSLSMLSKNLYYMLLPMITIIYFGYLICEKRDMLEECFSKARVPLNIYYTVNFVIILLQRNETFFLMPVDRITNPYYPDHMAGLLGIEGTHRLALVTAFVILLNMRYIIFAKSSRERTGSIFFLGFSAATALYTSSINDNNMVFVLLPVCILMFYMVKPSAKRGRWFKVAAIGVILFSLLFLLANSTYVSEVLGSRIGSAMKKIVGMLTGNGSTDERMVYMAHVFSELGGWLFGVGFGTIKMRLEPSIVALGHAYRNWGMSDIAPFTAMGGVWYYLTYLYICSAFLCGGKRLRRIRKYAFVLLLILTYYHQVLTHTTMTIPMCWIIALFVIHGEKRPSPGQETEADPEAAPVAAKKIPGYY